MFLKLLQYTTKFENLCYRALLLIVARRPAALHHLGAMESQAPPENESESAFQQDLQVAHKHIKVQEALTMENICHKLASQELRTPTIQTEPAFPASFAARHGHMTYTTPMRCIHPKF